MTTSPCGRGYNQRPHYIHRARRQKGRRPPTLHYMNEYQKQIIRYKHLRSIYYSDSENRVSLEDKEFKSMLIQLKRSIMAKRNRTNENQILFKSEFPEE